MINVEDIFIRRLPKYVLGTLTGTAVDTVVLWFFSHLVFRGYVGQCIISPIISFECAVFVNFLVCSNFTWKDRVVNKSVSAFLKRYLAYNTSCTGGFLIKMGFLLLIQHLSHWDVVVCNLLALVISGTFNFLMNEFVIFKKKKEISHGTNYNG